MLLQGMISENYVQQGTAHFLVLHNFKDYGTNWGYVKQGPTPYIIYTCFFEK